MANEDRLTPVQGVTGSLFTDGDGIQHLVEVQDLIDVEGEGEAAGKGKGKGRDISARRVDRTQDRFQLKFDKLDSDLQQLREDFEKMKDSELYAMKKDFEKMKKRVHEQEETIEKLKNKIDQQALAIAGHQRLLKRQLDAFCGVVF